MAEKLDLVYRLRSRSTKVDAETADLLAEAARIIEAARSTIWSAQGALEAVKL